MHGIQSILKVALVGAAAVALAGCGAANAAPTWTFPPGSASVPATQAPTSDGMAGMAGMAGMPGMAEQASSGGSGVVTRLDLTIVTGDMIGHTEYPAYVPSDFTLPANATVIVTITNFDDATPLPADMAQYASVSGTVGDTMQVTPINPAYPNSSAGTTTVASKLDPNAVSHTFTIPQLGINVPITAHARTTFVIHTGAPGTFAWRCFDPCGNGPTGWGTAMAANKGFMEGTLTVA